MKIRRIIFWFHLAAASIAGLVILILCISGATLVFASQILDWSVRDARHPGAPAVLSGRLSLDEALAHAVQAQPSMQIAGATLSADLGDAIVLKTQDREKWFVNPYSGDIREESEPKLRAFFEFMASLHKHLIVTFGQPIAAAADVVLLLLALSGLCLWWPRTWNWVTLRPAVWFVAGNRGRARDWNWHNVVAIWSLPVLVVLAATGVVFSYRSVNVEMFSLAKRYLKPERSAVLQISSPLLQHPGRIDSPLSVENFAEAIKANMPSWRTIELNFDPPIGATATSGRAKAPPHWDASVITNREWPPFDSTLVTLDPTTGTLSKRDEYASTAPEWRARRWVRLLHSGDAFGSLGRVVACVACLAACLLIYTGYAMALRRLFSRIRGTTGAFSRAKR